jgi:hypothetical protein
VKADMSMRDLIKQGVGATVAHAAPQCRYDRAIFVLAHMRCGSTALSNILCSRPDISGYGEAHIRYDGRAALGRLVVNQALRKAWKPRARYLFDKILHNRHDDAAPQAFFEARAIFVLRPPGAAVRSIRTLYNQLGRDEYGTDTAATVYYIERVQAMACQWARFDPARRVGLTSAGLLSDPDTALARISDRLTLRPPLENRYDSNAQACKGGAGDPLVSGRYNRIEPSTAASAPDLLDALEVPDAMRREAAAAHAACAALILGD